MKTPWKGLPDDVKHDILYGHDFKVNVSYRNRWGAPARILHRLRRR